MREIKFRAWDERNKEMVYDLTLQTSNGEPIKVCSFPNHTFLQYTGLKDKNGKEVYEGDIVIYRGYEVENGKQIRPIRTREIKNFIKDTYSLLCITENTGNLVEVIGNIHDNPEMLKEVPYVAQNKE